MGNVVKGKRNYIVDDDHVGYRQLAMLNGDPFGVTVLAGSALSTTPTAQYSHIDETNWLQFWCDCSLQCDKFLARGKWQNAPNIYINKRI